MKMKTKNGKSQNKIWMINGHKRDLKNSRAFDDSLIIFNIRIYILCKL